MLSSYLVATGVDDDGAWYLFQTSTMMLEMEMRRLQLPSLTHQRPLGS